MIHGIDHIVILVNDLDAATADYRALGFAVTPGGEHTGGATHNALVAFADGTYLELIAFRREEPGHRWWRHVGGGEGLIDFALWPGDIAAVIGAARERGLELEGPTPGGRLRPDGQAVEWQIGAPLTPDLPFLCYDVSRRELRVPQGGAQQHANGVSGIAEVAVVVEDVSASAARYAALLGVVGVERGGAVSFPAGGATITVMGARSHWAAAQLQGRGEGIAQLTFRTGVSHGARLVFAR